jgi:signal peptidase II
MSKKLNYTLFVFAIVILDRLTKLWALIFYNQERVVNDYLSLHQAFNRGVTWGLLHSENDYFFRAVTALIIVITALVAFQAYRNYKRGIPIWGELCILGGSLSNIIDRFLYGGVVDFIVVHKGDWAWPTFNVADSFIVIGVLFILIRQVFYDAGDKAPY